MNTLKKPMFHDLREYGAALWHYWILIMSGIAYVLIALFERYKGKPVRKYAFGLIAAGCILCAGFLTWRDEHSKLIVVNDALANVGPKFRLQVPSHGLSESGSFHIMWFEVELFNSGQPSITRDWRLKIHAVDHQSIDAVPWGLPFTPLTSFTNINSDGTINRIISLVDLITERTKNVPIQSGGMTNGIAMFIIPDASKEYLSVPGTYYEFSFRDVLDRLYTSGFSVPMPNRK